ncbi:hypothetical protein [Nonomuraea rubra]|uniref:Uncharacterized protein n=1 Tax=Nonomuraea rubra TaxID=46180 RepID=A0A7X0U3X1_9ACTN|nr:hypothetical protein [Nonomuraea rubra]MBB6553905.1 hypothetical protein [Nonomuraea rubra]
MARRGGERSGGGRETGNVRIPLPDGGSLTAGQGDGDSMTAGQGVT